MCCEVFDGFGGEVRGEEELRRGREGKGEDKDKGTGRDEVPSASS